MIWHHVKSCLEELLPLPVSVYQVRYPRVSNFGSWFARMLQASRRYLTPQADRLCQTWNHTARFHKSRFRYLYHNRSVGGRLLPLIQLTGLYQSMFIFNHSSFFHELTLLRWHGVERAFSRIRLCALKLRNMKPNQVAKYTASYWATWFGYIRLINWHGTDCTVGSD